MERTEGSQTPYEVYCYSCRVTFPVGQRRCIHCGARLGHRAELPHRRAGAMEPPIVVAEEEESGNAQMLRRFGGLAVWALLALSAVLSNMCRG